MSTIPLETIEKLISSAYGSSDYQERATATRTIHHFSQLEHWKTNLSIIQQSKQPHALHFAAINIRNIITEYSTSFKVEERLELRKILLHLLAELGGIPIFWGNPIVKSVLVECFCRLQKICWFESELTEDIIDEIIPFLSHSLTHSIIGFSLFRQLVYEISESMDQFPYSKQRKIAIAFREKCLKNIFQIGMQALKNLVKSDVHSTYQSHQSTLIEEILQLLTQILAYDFVGVLPDVTSDDIGIISMPDNWVDIFEDKEILIVIFNIYHHGLPFSTKCLDLLENLASVKSSIFTNEKRGIYLNIFIDGMIKILANKKDLEHEQNRHKIWRLLVRLKGNYQLKYLMETNNFNLFIKELVQFSVSVLIANSSLNSIYYLFN